MEALDCGAGSGLERKELDVELDMVAGHFFLVPRRMHRSAANLARKSAYAMALEDAINPCVRNLDVMITGEVPDDPHRPQMIGRRRWSTWSTTAAGVWFGCDFGPVVFGISPGSPCF